MGSGFIVLKKFLDMEKKDVRKLLMITWLLFDYVVVELEIHKPQCANSAKDPPC